MMAHSTQRRGSGFPMRLAVLSLGLTCGITGGPGFGPSFEAGVQAAGQATRAQVGGTAVADAAMRGDLNAVRQLLASGADVNAAQGDGMTGLHWAARLGHSALADVLLAAGARVDATSRLGAYTPLHLAAQSGRDDIVSALLAAGATPRAATTSGGATPLHFAAGAGRAASVTMLLDRGADPNVREAAHGQTPLMFAASFNRVEAMGVLIDRGADVELRTTALDLSVRDAEDRADERRQQAARALAASTPETEGAYGGGAGGRGGADTRTGTGAGGGGQAAPVQQEPNELEPESYAGMVGGLGGLTALLHAAREGHVDAAMLLLERGADVNQVSDGDHTSPMLMAMINGHFDLALSLLDRGADLNLSSDAGATPLYAALNLHWAPKSRFPQPSAHTQQRATYLEVMRTLLDAGADPNARLTKHLWYMSFNFDLLQVDTAGATPFWRAAYATDVEAMRLLIAYGADPGIPTIKLTADRRSGRGGGTPSSLPPVPVGGPSAFAIHAASGIGYGEGYAANSHRHVPDGWVPAIRYLVEELGADVNARDQNGYTPLHHAAARGDNALIEYLVSKGADVTLVSRRNQTTADMANGPVQRVQPFPSTVALLERLGSKNNHRCLSC